MSASDDARLARSLGHEFTDPGLLRQALTHRSYGRPNNERLEFLGDSLLNFVVGEALYQRFAQASEGELSRMRAALVRGDTLAQVAKQYDVGSHLHLGAGERKAGGDGRDSILADALEALVAAVYLDAGFDVCRQRVLTWFAEPLRHTTPAKPNKDAKTLLQEYLQARHQPLPVYHLVQTHGASHEQRFEVQCELSPSGRRFAGSGRSRRGAEQAAAKAALNGLEAEH